MVVIYTGGARVLYRSVRSSCWPVSADPVNSQVSSFHPMSGAGTSSWERPTDPGEDHLPDQGGAEMRSATSPTMYRVAVGSADIA